MLQEATAAGGSSEHSQPPNGLQNGPEQLPPPPSGHECISRQLIALIRAASRLVSHRVNQRVVTHGDATEGTHVASAATDHQFLVFKLGEWHIMNRFHAHSVRGLILSFWNRQGTSTWYPLERPHSYQFSVQYYFGPPAPCILFIISFTSVA